MSLFCMWEWILGIMIKFVRRRTLRTKSIIVIAVITGILGIGLLYFITTWIDEYTTPKSGSFDDMSCVKLLFFEYSPEYDKLNEQEMKEFLQARAPCLES